MREAEFKWQDEIYFGTFLYEKSPNCVCFNLHRYNQLFGRGQSIELKKYVN